MYLVFSEVSAINFTLFSGLALKLFVLAMCFIVFLKKKTLFESKHSLKMSGE